MLLALLLVAESSAVPVVRSEGLTPSERYLKRLCDRSFLSLWSYPNLFLNKAGGQELCDLLVVFDRHVIIFSDKSCEFPNTGDLKTDWMRWFRRSVAKSAKQVYGAERWIRSHPDRIFLDQQCKQQFPLQLPPADEITFHRIVVALGAGERCREYAGGSGSLMLMPMIQVGGAGDAWPFAVGDVAPDRGYVHVLDDVTLDVVLRELDTVADFTEYLDAKERLIRSGRLLAAAGEEDLLGYYMRNVTLNNREFRSSDSTEVIAIDEGFWTELTRHPQYLAKKELDRVSYVWDALIESFNGNIAAGTLAYATEHGIQAQERGVRVMAGEPRLTRRMFGETIMEKARATAPDQSSVRFFASKQRPDVGYVFIFEGKLGSQDYETYRARRTRKLEAYCRVAKHKQPQLLHVVGIATEPYGSGGSSEDMIYMDAALWNEADAELARELHERGLMKDSRQIDIGVRDFPELHQVERRDSAGQRCARNKRKAERRNRRQGR